VEADDLEDLGAVVVVVVLGAAVVGVVSSVPESEDVEDDVLDEEEFAEDELALVVVVGVVVVGAAPEVEWAVLPEATRIPRPTAPADAARPMPTVARRTRVMARSRARAAGWREVCGGGSCAGMTGLSVLGVTGRNTGVRISLGPSNRAKS
jgi:hypothetical protein